MSRSGAARKLVFGGPAVAFPLEVIDAEVKATYDPPRRSTMRPTTMRAA